VRALAAWLLQQLCFPASAIILLGVLRSTALLDPPVLHFHSAEMEASYVAWSSKKRHLTDGLFQGILLLGGVYSLLLLHSSSSSASAPTMKDGSMAGAAVKSLLAGLAVVSSALPLAALLLLQRPRYIRWREQLLGWSRLMASFASLAAAALQGGGSSGASASSAVAAAAAAAPVSLLHLAVAVSILAQLVGAVCMQVRLATFVPCQVLQLLLVLFMRVDSTPPLLQLLQLLGGGLCLPCLLLYKLELHSRRAFLVTSISSATALSPHGISAGSKAKAV
jgi:hypothetical protein